MNASGFASYTVRKCGRGFPHHPPCFNVRWKSVTNDPTYNPEYFFFRVRLPARRAAQDPHPLELRVGLAQRKLGRGAAAGHRHDQIRRRRITRVPRGDERAPALQRVRLHVVVYQVLLVLRRVLQHAVHAEDGAGRERRVEVARAVQRVARDDEGAAGVELDDHLLLLRRVVSHAPGREQRVANERVREDVELFNLIPGRVGRRGSPVGALPLGRRRVRVRGGRAPQRL
eukprot:31085-Pelagococcus_subviridis.AAC.7